METFAAYHGHHLIGLSSELWLLFETILCAPEEGEYMIVLVEYGSEDQALETGHLVFRGTRDDADAMSWN